MKGQVLILRFNRDSPSGSVVGAEQQLMVEMNMGLPKKLLLWFLR